jgi:two-component system, OmpR family, response regulator
MSYEGSGLNPDPDLVPEPSVLLVEDDPDVAQTLRRFIERSGLKISWARSGAEAVQLKESMRPDIVLVDLTLPDVDGSKLVRRFAAQHDCGVIVVSGRSDEFERVLGIELGADDYITKPVPSLRELLARIRAVHRRSYRRTAGNSSATAAVEPAPAAAPSDTTPSEVMLGSVRVDLRRRIALAGGTTPVHLTSAEFAALEQLIRSAPQPVSRDQICTYALRRPFHAEDRGVDQLILSLRRKLFADDSALSVIVSVRGQGYAIAADRELLAIKA